MKKTAFLTFVALLLLSLLLIVPASAQEMADTTAITLTAEGFTMPEAVESGLTTLTFDNQTEAPLTPIFARLNTDVTFEDFMAALADGPEAAVPLVTLLGSMAVMPMGTAEVTYPLEPGIHILLNLEGEMPQIGQFEVTGMADMAVEWPETDLTVSLVDFAFAIPLTVSSGEQTWLVRNIGEQWHEVAIFEIDPEMTITELREEVLAEPAEGEGEAGADEEFPAFLWLPMSPGQEAVVSVDLQAGTYAVVCFLPDFASGHAHFELGMFQVITVSE